MSILSPVSVSKAKLGEFVLPAMKTPPLLATEIDSAYSDLLDPKERAQRTFPSLPTSERKISLLLPLPSSETPPNFELL